MREACAKSVHERHICHVAKQGLKNWVEVEKDARACLHIKPEFIKGYKRLALAQRKLGNLKGALETVESGIGIDWFCYAHSVEHNNNTRKSFTEYWDNNPKPYRHLGQTGLKREPKNKELAKTRQKVKQEIAVAAKKSNLVDQKCDASFPHLSSPLWVSNSNSTFHRHRLFKAVQGSYQELQTQAEALQGQIAEVYANACMLDVHIRTHTAATQPRIHTNRRKGRELQIVRYKHSCRWKWNSEISTRRGSGPTSQSVRCRSFRQAPTPTWPSVKCSSRLPWKNLKIF